MFTTAFFVAKIWKQPRCPVIIEKDNQWTKKM